ncbi:O-antigen polymerase [Leptothrix sp. BB-4]
MLTALLLTLALFIPRYCRDKVISHAAAFVYIWILISLLTETIPWLLPVSSLAKLYIFTCVATYVGGVALGNHAPPQKIAALETRNVQRPASRTNIKRDRILLVTNGLSVALVLWLFIYWYQIASASPQELIYFLNETRYDAVRGDSIFGSLPIFLKSAAAHLFIFTIYLIAIGKTYGYWKPIVWLNITLAAAGSMLEGGRAGLIMYFLTFLSALHTTNKLSLKQVSKFIATLVLGFILIAIALRPSDSDSSIVAKIANHLATYALSPTILFGQWFENPTFNFSWNGPIYFLSMLGLMDPIDRSGTDVVPFWTAGEGLEGEPIEGNVYTAYCVILGNLGLYGGYVYWLTYGFICGFIEKRNTPRYISLMSLTLPSVILTIFAEYFISNAIITLKLLILHFAVWLYREIRNPNQKSMAASSMHQ